MQQIVLKIFMVLTYCSFQPLTLDFYQRHYFLDASPFSFPQPPVPLSRCGPSHEDLAQKPPVGLEGQEALGTRMTQAMMCFVYTVTCYISSMTQCQSITRRKTKGFLLLSVQLYLLNQKNLFSNEICFAKFYCYLS